jgi:ubiquinone/menaquinone biosynthesis C-methylase UbiE
MPRPDNAAGAIRRDPNPFEDAEIAARYEDWYRGHGQRAARLEKQALGGMLAAFPRASSVLEVGCGTGYFTRWVAGLGSRCVGLDRSLPMLWQARGWAKQLPWVLGEACALPFGNRSFDIVSLVTTLEFLAAPRDALAEAFRVARRGLLLGVLNRSSLLGRRLVRKGGPIWSQAHLFSPGELRRMVAAAAAGREHRLLVRAVLRPCLPGPLPLPCGGFIAMAVMLAEKAREGAAP